MSGLAQIHIADVEVAGFDLLHRLEPGVAGGRASHAAAQQIGGGEREGGGAQEAAARMVDRLSHVDTLV